MDSPLYLSRLSPEPKPGPTRLLPKMLPAPEGGAERAATANTPLYSSCARKEGRGTAPGLSRRPVGGPPGPGSAAGTCVFPTQSRRRWDSGRRSGSWCPVAGGGRGVCQLPPSSVLMPPGPGSPWEAWTQPSGWTSGSRNQIQSIIRPEPNPPSTEPADGVHGDPAQPCECVASRGA